MIRFKTRLGARLILLILLLGTSLFAQDKDGSGCDKIRDSDFVGMPISFDIVDLELADLMLFIQEETGCNSISSSEVWNVKLTGKVENIPWNTALRNILLANGLDLINTVSTNGTKYIFIADEEKILSEVDWRRNCYRREAPLITEVIYLKNLQSCSTTVRCGARDAEFARIVEAIKRMASERGTVETNNETGIITVTDIRISLDVMRGFINRIEAVIPGNHN